LALALCAYDDVRERERPVSLANGRYFYWGFVIFLAAIQVYANFGPPPSSPEAMAMMALFLYVALALLAAWVERIATASTEASPAR
jgi:uncharacterized membrane protein HdeD (DUF308 family)